MSGNVTGNVTAIMAYLRAKVNFFRGGGGKGDLLKISAACHLTKELRWQAALAIVFLKNHHTGVII
jgi:hypothetical protein